ncbi:hypothetical protein D3C80_1984730 [compost metagenome]
MGAFLSDFAISWLSLPVTASGMPAGPMMAYQPLTSKPDRPCSFTVGMRLSSGERWPLVTARACILPLRTCGMEVEMLSKLRSMSPASMALTTPALPL